MLACVHVHRCFCVRVRRILFSGRDTLKHVVDDWKHLQIGALQSESNLASLCTEHVFKEKEKKTWNVKQESQDLWKEKNVWLQG